MGEVLKSTPVLISFRRPVESLQEAMQLRNNLVQPAPVNQPGGTFRIGFFDQAGNFYRLKITDLTWNAYCESLRGPDADSHAIAALLTQLLKSRRVYLRIGLSRKWAKNPGKEWGQEVALGEGDVGMENYLRTLKEIGYTGPLTIEREISHEPERQKAEIGKAIKLLTELKAKIG